MVGEIGAAFITFWPVKIGDTSKKNPIQIYFESLFLHFNTMIMEGINQ